jgi:hypothetical protein
MHTTCQARAVLPDGMMFPFRSSEFPTWLIFGDQTGKVEFRLTRFDLPGNLVGGNFIANLDQFAIVAEIPDWDGRRASQFDTMHRHTLRLGQCGLQTNLPADYGENEFPQISIERMLISRC